MSNPIHPLALFRLSILGPLASRDKLKRGELKIIVTDIASNTHCIPGSKRSYLSREIIKHWYYLWKRGGIEALAPKTRCDKNTTQLSAHVKTALLAIKNDNPARSLNTLISMLESQGIVAKGKLARASVHRFLQQQGLSRRTVADAATIERRSFVAAFAGDIWQGDVLHGPRIQTPHGLRKTYLVSLLDDASRMITHCAFCFGEAALDIEGVLKQGIIKRGIPKKLIVDNGAAYKSTSLQSICARLNIRLIYCPAREPEGKGKIERYHRFFRETFLDEININAIQGLAELNARLWVWIENVYHQRVHGGLENKMTPLERWRQDLIHIHALGMQAASIDDIFCHRVSRLVRKDGTLSLDGQLFEVPYELCGKTIKVVMDPHTEKALRIESDTGKDLGLITLLDTAANLHRHRQRPEIKTTPPEALRTFHAVESAYKEYTQKCSIFNDTDKEDF